MFTAAKIGDFVRTLQRRMTAPLSYSTAGPPQVNDRVMRSRIELPTANRIGELVRALESRMTAPRRDFLSAVDEEKEKLAHELSSYDVSGTEIEGKISALLQLTRLINLLVNKHEYVNFSIKKIGRPSGFMLDPANACQLGCPSCQHSFNKEYTSRTYTQMPKGIMKQEAFAKFIQYLGSHAYSGHFYNNSEPFLNKNTASYLKIANQYRIDTLVSSNLSIPGLDAEAIVASGLNTLMCAIDGITQDVYEKYRRGGRLDVVFENVNNIVAAKKKLNSKTPWLRWQLLTFEHNVGQVDDAIELAKRIGFDSFNVATPFDVSMDEPTVHATQHQRVREGRPDIFFREQLNTEWQQPLAPLSDAIVKEFSESWSDRARSFIAENETIDPTRQVYGHCDWLHVGLIADALGRTVPCCIPDYKPRSFVFGQVGTDDDNLFNTDKYQQARLLFADHGRYKAATATAAQHEKSKCDGCVDGRPLPQIGLGAVAAYLTRPTNDVYAGWLADPEISKMVIGWSRHGGPAMKV